jgi:hypothetical protein
MMQVKQRGGTPRPAGRLEPGSSAELDVNTLHFFILL